MAEIYLLQEDKGKTLTLITLCNILERSYGLPLTPIEYSSRGKPKDINVTLTDVKGKKVGITSQGDVPATIKNEIYNFLQNNCDIIFCACRLTEETVNAVNEFSADNKIDFTRQVIQNHIYNAPGSDKTMQNQCNECMANHLKDKAEL
jgi:hypothetical protein